MNCNASSLLACGLITAGCIATQGVEGERGDGRGEEEGLGVQVGGAE